MELSPSFNSTFFFSLARWLRRELSIEIWLSIFSLSKNFWFLFA